MDVAAFHALEPVLADHVQTLPLACDEQELIGVWAADVLDVLDEAASRIIRFSESQRPMAIERHVFTLGALGDAAIFRLSQLRAGPIYMTGVVVAVIRAAGLSGWDLQPVR